MLLDRQALEAQLRELVQARERMVIEVHRHDGAIAVLTTVLSEPEHQSAVSHFPMPVNSTTTTQ